MLVLGTLASVVGLAVFLWGLPVCRGKFRTDPVHSLLGRIDREQHTYLEHSFGQAPSKWRIVRYLEQQNGLLERICKLTGINMDQTADMLYRLRSGYTLAEVAAAKAIGGVVLLAIIIQVGFRLSAGQPWNAKTALPVLAAVLLFLLPTLLLEWADKRAKAEIREQVPIFFSIVQSLVEAGMPIQSAVTQTASRFAGRLGQELARLETEERRSGNWRKALEDTAFRWEVDSLSAIAMEINEAMSKGVSIAQMIAAQVEEQVRQQEDEASDHMNRLNVRLLPFVIVLMGVPLLFLVMGPIFIGIDERL
ncbi:type II secretion system F family protein [Brevibacillus ruminantium]|uniref:Type II secretion system F family protein n=1 Tax=Brevibacillus ruminantium TaxID=2950604 RepID=A0ABY4WKT2_9BACL|nr:type II secretion system F family protein [Brevibacillus ruminantium]USG65974.1 type II secretion system F family protein [Brevibacillus ruminantium]